MEIFVVSISCTYIMGEHWVSEEAVQEVKRAAVAEVQRAVAVAVAESRANERLRVHRLLDLPLPHRSHAALRQSSYIRVAAHINPGSQEAASRPGEGTPTTTSLSGTSGVGEDEKDAGHMANVIGSVSTEKKNY